MPTILKDNRIVQIEQVVPNTWNPKDAIADNPENAKNYERIKKSLAAHGQLDPILVREVNGRFEIVNGYHRYMALKEAGADEVEIKNLGKIDDARAKAIALATEDAKVSLNRVKVAEMVDAILSADPSMLDLFPYNEGDVSEMRGLLDFEWPQDQPEPEAKKGISIKVPEDRLADWNKLKEKYDAPSDQALLVLFMDKALKE